MSQHALRLVLQLADAPSTAALGYDDVMRWSEEARSALLHAGWLRDAGIQQQFTCTDCEEECTEEVLYSGEIPFIMCPRGLGRITIRPETLRRWVVDTRGIAASLCEMLGVNREPQEIVKDRLWWLGRIPVHRQQVSVFFAKGTNRRDAVAVYADVGELQGADVRVVLVPGRVPAPDVLGPSTKVLTLQQVVGLGPGGLRVDRAPVEEIVPRSRARVAQAFVPIHTSPGITWNQVLIEFLDEETVRVSVPGQVPQERSFVEMGFQDRRKVGEQADTLWGVLRILARHDGRLESGDADRVIAAASFGKVKKWIGDLRKRLRAVFPDIAGDPFKPYRQAKPTGDQFEPYLLARPKVARGQAYREANAYETKFVLRWEGLSPKR